MGKISLILSVLAAAAVPPVSPVLAKGPPPKTSTETCVDDVPGVGWTQCYYDSRDECTWRVRALRRQVTYVNGCWLVTAADPDDDVYGKWALEYY